MLYLVAELLFQPVSVQLQSQDPEEALERRLYTQYLCNHLETFCQDEVIVLGKKQGKVGN